MCVKTSRMLLALCAALVLALAGCSSSPSTVAAAGTPTAAKPATHVVSLAVSPTPSASAGVPADPLTGYGATITTWDATHTADTTFAAGSVYDPNPALPQINGNEGARYAAVTPLAGLVENYTVDEMADTSTTAAFADVVSRELPSDTLVLWKRDQSANGCYQEEVQSKTLARSSAVRVRYWPKPSPPTRPRTTRRMSQP